jgi:hypothetical protein
MLQSASPSGSYAAPFAGVITSWSFEAAASAPATLKLKVGRPAGGNSFSIVGESPPKAPTGGAVNTYTDVRIPVRAGDVMGYFALQGGVSSTCTKPGGAGFAVVVRGGDQPPSSTVAGYGTPVSQSQLDLSATLERDADGDGFGDETQDRCPGEPGPSNGCPVASGDATAPDTTMTEHPDDKASRKQATFEFTSSEPGSAFECSLDGAAFAPCTSPDTLTVKKGRHSFEVRAKDAAGNVDGSPASDDWKVKKKRKK